MKKLIMLFALLPMFFFSGCGVYTIDSGEVGVQVTNGKVSDNILTEGLQIIFNPWSKIDTYNVKAKNLEMTAASANTKDTVETMYDSAVTITTKDNLQVPVDITLLYKLADQCAPHIRKEFGTEINWDNKTIIPVARSVVRDVISKDADIYTLNQNREAYSASIKSEFVTKVNNTIGKQCISVEMVAIRDIHLPKQLTDSIMIKNQMEEQARTAELQVKKARAEADIEITRAQGTAQAQLALAKSLTPEMIRWKQLENDRAAIDKWNGIQPTTLLGNTPTTFMINK